MSLLARHWLTHGLNAVRRNVDETDTGRKALERSMARMPKATQISTGR